MPPFATQYGSTTPAKTYLKARLATELDASSWRETAGNVSEGKGAFTADGRRFAILNSGQLIFAPNRFCVTFAPP